jgi:luciferase family oxidoreductase group 1
VHDPREGGRPVRLGVLDFGQNFDHTLTCARTAEALGFTRYWLGEHHGRDDAWGSPNIAIGLIAAATSAIAVGSAGVLLGAHHPLRVASDFAFLANTFGDRIDLGVARGMPVLDGVRQAYLDHGFADDFEHRVRYLELMATANRGGAVRPAPLFRVPPRIWIMGSGGAGSEIAERRKLRYAHAVFLAGEERFRDNAAALRPLYRRTGLEAVVAVAGVCAPTRAEASAVTRIPSTIVKESFSGDPMECADVMERIARYVDAAELIFLDCAWGLKDRVRSLELLQREFEKRYGPMRPLPAHEESPHEPPAAVTA